MLRKNYRWLLIDEDGTEWSEDEDGYWWYREEGQDDGSHTMNEPMLVN